MLTFEINKTFANDEEAQKWEDENLPEREYQGHPVLMVNKSASVKSPEVTIEKIVCI